MEAIPVVLNESSTRPLRITNLFLLRPFLTVASHHGSTPWPGAYTWPQQKAELFQCNNTWSIRSSPGELLPQAPPAFLPFHVTSHLHDELLARAAGTKHKLPRPVSKTLLGILPLHVYSAKQY